jgi:predicted transcriptional regulator
LVRAGRALLDWSQQDLADQAGVKRLVVVRYENGTQTPHPRNLNRLISAFTLAGVEAIACDNGGVGVVIHQLGPTVPKDRNKGGGDDS